MTKLLEDAVEKVRGLPAEEQDLAAEMLFLIANRHNGPYQLDADEQKAVRQGLAEAGRGEFLPPEKTDELLKRPWR